MSTLTVIALEDGTLVVDSRSIAQDLGIEHKNLMANVYKYQEIVEEAFGRVAFETETLETAGGLQKVKYCYLTGRCYRAVEEALNRYSKLIAINE